MYSPGTLLLPVRRASLALVLILLALTPGRATAQRWRRSADGLGTTDRVLIIGTRPQDEDNALIAWLSLGRHVETAYLSLTRGESGPNVAGTEQGSALAIVRTAELLAERQLDGAHQYFTRAYDFGFSRSDSVVAAAWPHDSLLKDVVSVIRAFRPHVIIVPAADSSEPDATRRVTAQLAREAFAAAADSVRWPPAAASLLPPWMVSQLFTKLERADPLTPNILVIDAGGIDRATGQSHAAIGAEIRRLQRTQPPRSIPAGADERRYLRRDSTRAGALATDPFVALDTLLERFRAQDELARIPSLSTQLGALRAALQAARRVVQAGIGDSLTAPLGRVVRQTTNVHLALPCPDLAGVPRCGGAAGDLAVSLGRIRDEAVDALLGVARVAIDATASRQFVAAGDSVPIEVRVVNGGAASVVVLNVRAAADATPSFLTREATVIPSDSTVRWSCSLRVGPAAFNWWLLYGLQTGTWARVLTGSPSDQFVPSLILGEDRIPTSVLTAIATIDGNTIPIVVTPILHRPPGAANGDVRRPLVSVTRLSVLLERAAEYARAGQPMDQVLRVELSTARTVPERVEVSIRLPRGLTADSASRVVVLAPSATGTVLFRVRGTLAPGSDSIHATARILARTIGSIPGGARPLATGQEQRGGRPYQLGTVRREYPHLPTLSFVRVSSERLEAVALRVPAGLRVGYVGNDAETPAALARLQIDVESLKPSAVRTADLSTFTALLIGARALADTAAPGIVPALQAYLQRGGTVVVLPGNREIVRNGLLPFPISFDSVRTGEFDLDAMIRAADTESALVGWPNGITAKDLEEWSGNRARDIPLAVDPRYRVPFTVQSAERSAAMPAVLLAPVGRGTLVYASLSLDYQLALVHGGAARLLVNLLSAGLARDARM